jgi:hypothetical protein
MFHSFDDLKKLLPEKFRNNENTDEYNYGEDAENQLLTIIDSKSDDLSKTKKIKIIKLK